MRRTLLIILIFLSIVSISLQVGTDLLKRYLGPATKAGIRVEANVPAKVLLNDQEVGSVPFQDDSLKPGDYHVLLRSDEATDSAKVFWQGYARLNEGSLTIVIRDIADDKNSSAGEVISLDSGSGATVTSSPSNAEVFIDGSLVGRTPISVPSLSVGEHQFIVSRENFLKRSIRSRVIEGLNLVINVDLAITEPDLTKLPATPITSTQLVIIKSTPTGFLRVRESASVNSKEIGQVKPKEEYVLLEETPGWARIRLKDGKEGWVSSAYIQKKTDQEPK